MEAIQTLNPADVWEVAQKVIVWLAGIGIVIDLTPGIKVQPVRWLIKQLGNLMNHDMKEQLDQLQKDFTDHKVDSWRMEILEFQSSCINHRRHTKEEFDHIIDILAKYDKYIKDRKFGNDVILKNVSIHIHCGEPVSYTHLLPSRCGRPPRAPPPPYPAPRGLAPPAEALLPG